VPKLFEDPTSDEQLPNSLLNKKAPSQICLGQSTAPSRMAQNPSNSGKEAVVHEESDHAHAIQPRPIAIDALRVQTPEPKLPRVRLVTPAPAHGDMRTF